MAVVTETQTIAKPARRIRTDRLSRSWSSVWPKLLAVAIFVAVWQAVVWTHWKTEVVIPSPFTVFARVGDDRTNLWKAAVVTLKRGLLGYLVAVLVGGIVGISVARVRVLRDAIGSMVTGLQTMPSVAWLPLAAILFKLGENAIFFVVVLGAAPSIANGIIDGIDHVPPILLRAGRVLGARGFTALRHIVIPAALPSVMSGLKQGWAFAWRSLMAGELITTIPGHQGLGNYMNVSKDFADYTGVYAAMVVIFVIGIIIDAVFFGTAVRTINRRWGLVESE
jgi:NitT/TauT family transport system permease protein